MRGLSNNVFVQINYHNNKNVIDKGKAILYEVDFQKMILFVFMIQDPYSIMD